MNNELTYKAKDGVEYKYTIKELTLAVKPVWNKIVTSIEGYVKLFCNEDDLKLLREYETQIADLTMQKELAEINCKQADIPSPTEQDTVKLNNLIKIHDELDIRLNELQDKKNNDSEVVTNGLRYSKGVFRAIDNALLEDGNELIYESTLNLLNGDVSKLDLTDTECYDKIIKPAVVAFFLNTFGN